MSAGWRDRSEASECSWDSLPPGPGLAAKLAEIDPGTLDDSDRVAYLAATDRLLGWSHMLQAKALVAVSDAVCAATATPNVEFSSHQQGWVADEVAAALHIAARTATGRVNAASALVRDWPRLGEAVASGELTLGQAREVYEAASILSGCADETGADLSDRAVEMSMFFARDLPPARLRERMNRLVSSLDPEAATRRRRRAERDRTDVSMWAEADGIACLSARGPSLDTVAVRDLIDARARAMRQAADEGDDRTLGQWRHAALLSAFGLAPVGRVGVRRAGDESTATALSEPASVVDDPPLTHPDVQIRVTVPLTTLFGLTDTPGELEGFGPLDPELVRALAADAQWQRWVTDPVGDYLIDEGRQRFPGARLARFLRARESRCKHPSCGVRSRNCDADHLPAFGAGGQTSAQGLSPTCPRHNRGRVASGWRVEEDGPKDPHGPPDPIWVSTLGRRYENSMPAVFTDDYIPLRR